MTRLGACVLAALLLTGCSGGSERHPVVYAASSLTQVFERLEPDARYDFAGSNALALQLEQGAPADVYAAASPKYPRGLYAKGLIEKPRVFATNTLVLIVPRGNPGRVSGLVSLLRPQVTLVRGANGVPVGDYTETVLERWCRSLPRGPCPRARDSEEPDVKSVVAKVALGEADAGFVYATDVKPLAGKVRVIRIRRALQPTIRYPIAVVRSTKHRKQAEAFVRLVLGSRGRAALRSAGFGLP